MIMNFRGTNYKQYFLHIPKTSYTLVASLVGYIGVDIMGIEDNLGLGFREWNMENLENHF